MLAALRAHAFLGLGHRPHAGKVLVNLVIQVAPVGDDHESPVAGQLAQHLLGEEDHRVGLAAALGMPEDAEGSGACSGSIKLDTPLRGGVHFRREVHYGRTTEIQSRIQSPCSA